MASVGTIYSQMFPPKPKWDVDQIPDLSGKVVIVTGGNTGIGKETCRELLKKNAKVYLAARSKSKAEEAINDLEKDTGKRAIFLELDLANLASVKAAAEQYKSSETQLHVLFNNAGVMTPPIDQVTAQNYDMQFGTNTIAPYLLIRLLWPVLLSTAEASGEPSRVVWTSSSVNYYFKPPLKYDTLKDSPARKKLGPSQLYCQSKFGACMLGYAFARRSEKENGGKIVVTVVDPGNIRSELQRHNQGLGSKIMFKFILHPLRFGAISQLYAGTAPEAASYNGRYIRPWARLGEPHKQTKDEKEQEKLWQWIEDEVKEYL
ncbi:NAD(P)-binding protein [Punctularia strigosozonata HHB-11173 SS5]|uniref:NAD(P)-binding protein n=1 Tax=Punctularia strigosozonata (strain HHB-11173) TaxID=741275 RepID=UPI0004417EA5|nr:NAD(P)-binding protein [Punctularia strigosozonata HHB-11173 SS5]EIN08964.1 NAD(P)-binding protein [Punctularia strigosozonata HHB-11173 SS5]